MIELSPHLIAIVAFFVLFLMWVLNLLLYRPILKGLDERREIVDGAARDAENARSRIEKLQEEYGLAMKKARSEAKAVYNKYREEALAKEKEIVTETEKEMEKVMGKAMTRLEKNTDSAKEELRSYAESLSRDIGEKILGRAF